MVTTRSKALAKDTVAGKQQQIPPKQIKKITSNGTKATTISNGWLNYKDKVKSSVKKKWMLLTEPSLCSWWPFPVFLLLVDMIINLVIIENVNYTEIDWKAYMQEVSSTPLLNPGNGTTDYSTIKGDTGPLVYPAGFVWIYSILYKLTNEGKDIKRAQYIFGLLYILTVALVCRLSIRTKKIPAYALAVMCLTSKRIHSIYVLRLFNDPIAMLLLYTAINAFCDGWWTVGSILYSIAVSVKMNILLFAPALFLAYIATGGLFRAIKQVSICALIQVIVGFPFLTTYPIEYLKGSFDIGRVFLFKWTVNWRFVPEEFFVHKGFHAILLLMHLIVLALFAPRWWKMLKSYNKNRTPELLLIPLYTSNFIGIMFARSLHYQFYIWYFHQLHLLIYVTKMKEVSKLTILGLIELCWNIYPSTNESSALLHICHFIVLYNLTLIPSVPIDKKDSNENVKSD